MIGWLFGPRVTVKVRVLGLVGQSVIHYDGEVRLRPPQTVRAALGAASRGAGADLLGAIEDGMQPVLLLDGLRLNLPEGLDRALHEGAHLQWLMPMAGG